MHLVLKIIQPEESNISRLSFGHFGFVGLLDHLIEDGQQPLYAIEREYTSFFA